MAGNMIISNQLNLNFKDFFITEVFKIIAIKDDITISIA